MPPRKILLNRQTSPTSTQSARNASKVSHSGPVGAEDKNSDDRSEEVINNTYNNSRKVSIKSFEPTKATASARTSRVVDSKSARVSRPEESVRVEKETSRISVDDALKLLPKEVRKISRVPIIEDHLLTSKTDRSPAGKTDRRTASETDRRTASETDRRTAGKTDRRTASETDRRTASGTDRLAVSRKNSRDKSPERVSPRSLTSRVSKPSESKRPDPKESETRVSRVPVASEDPVSRSFTSERAKSQSVKSRIHPLDVEPSKSPILVKDKHDEIKIVDRSYNSRRITASPTFEENKRPIVLPELTRSERDVSRASSRRSRDEFEEERQRFEEERRAFIEEKLREEERKKNLKENIKIEMRIKQIEKQFGIIIPQDPEQRYETYNAVILELKKRSFRKNGRRLLLFVSVAIEFALVDLLGIACSGFATDQLNQIREYDDIIDDLGDKWFFSGGAGISPEVRLGLLFGFNLFLFVMSNYALRAGVPGVETGKTVVRDLVTKTFLVDDPPIEEVPEDGTATMQFGLYRVYRAGKDSMAATPQKEQAGPSRPKGPVYMD